MLLAVAWASPLLFATPAQAEPAGTAVTVFESRAPGNPAGGGLNVSTSHVAAYSFAINAPTHVTALGARLANLGATDISAYLALYRLETPYSIFDAAADSDLLATTLVTVPGSSNGVLSGPVSVTLQPGWYAVGIGVGRNGAGTDSVQWPSVDTPNSPGVDHAYTVNTTSNQRTLQGAQPRVFVMGYALEQYPPAAEYAMRSAQPWATWAESDYGIDSELALAVRFELDHRQRVERVAVWGWGGNGSVVASLVPLASIDDTPPPFASAAFDAQLLGNALIDVGNQFRNYSGDFGGLWLEPGAYALVIGSGAYGASGELIAMIVDSGELLPMLLGINNWIPAKVTAHFALFGPRGRIAASPSPVVFPATAVGNSSTRQLTVTNISTVPVAMGGWSVTGSKVGDFANAGTGTCAGATLAPFAQCAIDMNFSPQQTGASTAMLRISGSGDPTPLAVPLLGDIPALLVAVDNDSSHVAYGSTPIYTISISNPMPGTDTAAMVSVPLPPAVEASSANWSCSGFDGAACVAPSGTGAIAEAGVSLPAGGSVIFALNAPVAADSSAPGLHVQATASSAADWTAADSDVLVLFRDGFD